MSIEFLIFIAIVKVVIGQVPSTIQTCYQQSTPHRFCSPTTGISTVTNTTSITTGYCCEDQNQNQSCTESEAFACTLNQQQMALPLWMSYWVGMNPNLCGVQSFYLTATQELQTYQIKQFTLGSPRIPENPVESCFYIIQAEKDVWTDDSKIYIFLNQSFSSDMYLFEGNNRRNSSLVIEQNLTAAIGAPYRIPISSSAVLILMSNDQNLAQGNITFSFYIEGKKYKWYESPFINIWIGWYYIFLIFLTLEIVLVICCPIGVSLQSCLIIFLVSSATCSMSMTVWYCCCCCWRCCGNKQNFSKKTMKMNQKNKINTGDLQVIKQEKKHVQVHDKQITQDTQSSILTLTSLQPLSSSVENTQFENTTNLQHIAALVDTGENVLPQENLDAEMKIDRKKRSYSQYHGESQFVFVKFTKTERQEKLKQLYHDPFEKTLTLNESINLVPAVITQNRIKRRGKQINI